MKAEMLGDFASDQNVLDAEAHLMMVTPISELTGPDGVVADSYGSGHFIETLSNGDIAVWHGGQTVYVRSLAGFPGLSFEECAAPLSHCRVLITRVLNRAVSLFALLAVLAIVVLLFPQKERFYDD